MGTCSKNEYNKTPFNYKFMIIKTIISFLFSYKREVLFILLIIYSVIISSLFFKRVSVIEEINNKNEIDSLTNVINNRHEIDSINIFNNHKLKIKNDSLMNVGIKTIIIKQKKINVKLKKDTTDVNDNPVNISEFTKLIRE